MEVEESAGEAVAQEETRVTLEQQAGNVQEALEIRERLDEDESNRAKEAPEETMLGGDGEGGAEVEDGEDGAEAEGGEDNDEEDEDEEDESDDEPVEQLASGRERRATQGNRYASLLQHEVASQDDDDLTLLFAETEEEEDAEFEDPDAEVEASEVHEEEDDSSTDDEDQGPVAGEDDLEGERQLKKEERATRQTQKRKADKVFAGIPTIRKRVKIDESATGDAADEEPAERKRKKSERVSWVPTDAPIRTSSRTLSVQNKVKTLASMKASESRRKRQIAVMEEAQKRRKANRARTLTQAEHMEEAARVERINSKSLNRWEELEKEKERKQKARLEAMQNRKIEGPLIRFYSAQAEWVGDKLKRVGKRVKHEVVEEKAQVEDETTPPDGKDSPSETTGDAKDSATEVTGNVKESQPQPSLETPVSELVSETQTPAEVVVGEDDPLEDKSGNKDPEDEPMDGISAEDQSGEDQAPKEAPPGDKTEEKSSEEIPPESTVPEAARTEDVLPTDIPAEKMAAEGTPGDVPSLKTPAEDTHMVDTPTEERPQNDAPALTQAEEVETVQPQHVSSPGNEHSQPTLFDQLNFFASQHGEETGTSTDTKPTATVDTGKEAQPPRETAPADAQASSNQDTDGQTGQDTPAEHQPAQSEHPGDKDQHEPQDLPPASPPKTTYSTRNLISLINFDPTSIRSPDVQKNVLLHTPLPHSVIISTRANASTRPLPLKYQHPTKPVCVITSQPAKYRDPHTGLPYANLEAYKAIKKLVDGGCVWSNLLGAWCGSDGKAVGGSGAAKGVPEAFFTGKVESRDAEDKPAAEVGLKAEPT